MGYYSDQQIDTQEHEAHMRDCEPDYDDYAKAKEYMKTDEYAKDYAVFESKEHCNVICIDDDTGEEFIYNDGEK